MSNGEQSVHRIQVKIPPFWHSDPELWFAQIETQFSLAGITVDETKFYYVCGNLDAKYAAEVRDILTNPPAEEKYNKLKKELIKRFTLTQEQKTKQLLEREELGDRKPSQFLRHMRTLAGTMIPDPLLKFQWLSRLPSATQAILVTQKAADLDTLVELADAVHEVSPHHQVSEASLSAPSMEEMMERFTTTLTSNIREVTEKFQQEIAGIKEDMRRPKFHKTSDTYPRRQSWQRSKNRFDRHDVCWYHWRFGDAATKCTDPCRFKGSRSGNDPGSL
ncbi:uncharacterized protein LOC128984130 [Macrosteles quadrilineatus]|uniref:uncharacterized protein LOC128984130 n=1 Tax=Macrosteles quadrilineatus TaxID=74068 RepID=UPI0023E099E1|nr:uncharacterized protein LOC128984130 [Macrosteles quadrilineatus]